MTPTSVVRLATVAVTLSAIQSLLLDAAGSGPFRAADLPLAAVVALVFLRPESTVTVGFIFGLAVDVFHTRLFGVHCLAYSGLGLVAAGVPTGALRTRFETIALVAAAQSLVAVTVIIGALWMTSGRLPPDTFGRYTQTTIWTLVIVVPIIMNSGVQIGLSTPEPPPRGALQAGGEWP